MRKAQAAGLDQSAAIEQLRSFVDLKVVLDMLAGAAFYIFALSS